MFSLGSDKNNAVQNFKNPFDKEGVDYVTFSFHRSKSMFRNDKKGKAVVNFQKGNTNGSQEFYSDDFQDLVRQVDIFINSLK